MRDLKDIGIWNMEIASDPSKFGQINITGSEIAQDQLIQLYIMLYPFLATEFVHRSDLQHWAENISKQFQDKIEKTNIDLDLLVQEAKTHFHAGQGLTPSSTAAALSTPKIEKWSSYPEDSEFKDGEKLIVDSSKYTKSIKHRDPVKEPMFSKPKMLISKIFALTQKFIPFDINKNSINTGDNSFVNK